MQLPFSASTLALTTAIATLPANAATVGHWEVLDGSGALLEDSSGQGNDVTTTATGWDDGRLCVDAGEYGVADDPGGMDGMPALTVEIIFSLDADYLGNPRFFQAGAPGDAVAFNFGILGGSEVLAGDVNGFNPDYSGATQVSLGEIHHAAMVYDGATLEFYLDGNLDATHILAAGALWDIPSLYVFSEAGGGQFFDGCMYEARISDTALDPSGFLPIGLRVATARATVVSRPGSIVGFTGWARDLGNAPLSFDGAKIRITGPLNDSNVLYDGSAIWLGPSEALSHTFVLPVDASAIAGIYTYELALTSGGTDIASDTFEVDVRTP